MCNKTNRYAVPTNPRAAAVPEQVTKILKKARQQELIKPNRKPNIRPFKRAIIHFFGMRSCGDSSDWKIFPYSQKLPCQLGEIRKVSLLG